MHLNFCFTRSYITTIARALLCSIALQSMTLQLKADHELAWSIFATIAVTVGGGGWWWYSSNAKYRALGAAHTDATKSFLCTLRLTEGLKDFSLQEQYETACHAVGCTMNSENLYLALNAEVKKLAQHRQVILEYCENNDTYVTNAAKTVTLIHELLEIACDLQEILKNHLGFDEKVYCDARLTNQHLKEIEERILPLGFQQRREEYQELVTQGERKIQTIDTTTQKIKNVSPIYWQTAEKDLIDLQKTITEIKTSSHFKELRLHDAHFRDELARCEDTIANLQSVIDAKKAARANVLIQEVSKIQAQYKRNKSSLQEYKTQLKTITKELHNLHLGTEETNIALMWSEWACGEIADQERKVREEHERRERENREQQARIAQENREREERERQAQEERDRVLAQQIALQEERREEERVRVAQEKVAQQAREQREHQARAAQAEQQRAERARKIQEERDRQVAQQLALEEKQRVEQEENDRKLAQKLALEEKKQEEQRKKAKHDAILADIRAHRKDRHMSDETKKAKLSALIQEAVQAGISNQEAEVRKANRWLKNHTTSQSAPHRTPTQSYQQPAPTTRSESTNQPRSVSQNPHPVQTPEQIAAQARGDIQGILLRKIEILSNKATLSNTEKLDLDGFIKEAEKLGLAGHSTVRNARDLLAALKFSLTQSQPAEAVLTPEQQKVLVDIAAMLKFEYIGESELRALIQKAENLKLGNYPVVVEAQELLAGLEVSRKQREAVQRKLDADRAAQKNNQSGPGLSTSASTQEQETACTICFEEKQDMHYTACCKKPMCQTCYNTWKATQRQNNVVSSCPHCRKEQFTLKPTR